MTGTPGVGTVTIPVPSPPPNLPYPPQPSAPFVPPPGAGMPTFSGLSEQTITYGTGLTAVSGHLNSNADGQNIPPGETVNITLNGVIQQATLDSNDNFSATFNTKMLGVSGSPYTIGFSYTGDGNYSAATATSTLTINRAPLTVTADDQSMVYGASVPSLMYSITGFVSGDTTSVVSGSPSLTTAATSASGAGGYSIAVTEGSLSAANYAFPNLINGTLTVNPAPLAVTAEDQTMVYGASVPSLSYSITGFVNGDTTGVVSGTPGLSTTATSSSKVGNYPIAVSVAGLSASNYSFTGQSAMLTIKKAHLTVAPVPESKRYGAALPSLGYTITGFVNGQNASVVSGAPDLSTAVKSSSGVGSYPITVTAGTLSAANYDFPNLVNGTLSVTRAPLTIEVNDVSRLVGQPNPPFTVSYNGFVNGDGPSALKSPPSLSTSATTSSPAGVYPIIVSGASSPNYTITFIPGTLTVSSPPLVTMSGVVDKTNKKHQVTEIFVTFSSAVNAAEADSINTYRLATPGRKGSYTAKNSGIIKLKSAVYNGSSDTVALTPKAPFGLTKPVQLLVYGTGSSGLQDAEGRLIDGDHNGTPGGNAVAILSKNRVTIDAVPMARTSGQTAVGAVVDALLERDDLAGLSHARRAVSLFKSQGGQQK